MDPARIEGLAVGGSQRIEATADVVDALISPVGPPDIRGVMAESSQLLDPSITGRPISSAACRRWISLLDVQDLAETYRETT